MTDNEALIAETRERSTFAEYEAAEDVLWWAARARVLAYALEAAERKPVIDREKFLAWCVAFFGDPDELPEDYAEQWGSFLLAGLVDDKRAVQEEAWDYCLDEIEANELNTEQAREGNPYRATEIREGRA